MDVSIIFKIAGIGILTGALHSILKAFGKEEQAYLATLAGITIVLFMVVQLLASLFDYVRSVFSLY